MRSSLLPLLLSALACDPNVVDAVREPMPLPIAGTAGGGAGGTSGAQGGTGNMGPMGGEPSGGDGPQSPLAVSLVHRYSFDGDGETAIDARSDAHGQVLGTTLNGDGTLTLAGARTGQYVNLPNGLISTLTDATFEAWLTWSGGNNWQRIFDFGNSSEGEDLQGPTGTSYLFLTANTSPDSARQVPSVMRLAYSQDGALDEVACNAPSRLPVDVPTHVAVVIDSGAQTMALYQDGARLAQCALTRPLSGIEDVNNWLGRSNYQADVDLSGTYDEFRIYAAALSAEELLESFAAGPDARP